MEAPLEALKTAYEEIAATNRSNWGKCDPYLYTSIQHRDAAGKHLPLIITVWGSQKFERTLSAGLVTIGKIYAAQSTEKWHCSVFRTHDSLFILPMENDVTVFWDGNDSKVIEGGDILRVPMARRPVTLTFHADPLPTIVRVACDDDVPPKFIPCTLELCHLLFDPCNLLTDMLSRITTAHLLEVLLWFGLDVAQIDNDGNTMLHHACASFRVDVVKVLLKTCDINIVNHLGQTPLWSALMVHTMDIADKQCQINVVHTLLERGAIFGRRAARKVWAKLLVADKPFQDYFRELVSPGRSQAINTVLMTNVPSSIVDLVVAFDVATWAATLDVLIHGVEGSTVDPTPYHVSLDQDRVIDKDMKENAQLVSAVIPTTIKYIPTRLGLTTTVWSSGPDIMLPHVATTMLSHVTKTHIGSAVSIGSDHACHVRLEGNPALTCIVFRTEDSLFVIHAGNKSTFLLCDEDQDIQFDKASSIRYPMLRDPVAIMFEHGENSGIEIIVVITPSEYYVEGPTEAKRQWSENLMGPDLPVNPTLDQLTFLLHAGLDVHRTDVHGNTLLHTVVQDRQTPDNVIDLLLARQYDVNAVNRERNTPLMCILMCTDLEWFIKRGRATQLLKAGARCGADARVRGMYLAATPETKEEHGNMVFEVDDRVTTWENVLDRLIYGETWKSRFA